MKIGLSTYSFFWEIHHELIENEGDPLDVLKFMISETTKLAKGEKSVFQICDFPHIFNLTATQYEILREYSSDLGVELELGIRGVDNLKLSQALDVCKKLDVTTLRTMLIPDGNSDVVNDAVVHINGVVNQYEENNVFIVLENYELVKTDILLSVLEKVNSKNLLVCLDPANSIAALEMPKEVIDLLAPYTRNLHVKDFGFSREEGWVGFKYTGRKLGEGQLDIDYLLSKVINNKYVKSAIVELWVPKLPSIEETIQKEKDWRESSFNFLLNKSQIIKKGYKYEKH